jgi:glycerate dehydrogenase
MKIAILDANTLGSDIDLSVFEELGDVVVYGFTAPEEVVERIKDVDVIIANKVQLNESNLGSAPRVKLICLTATGSNNVDKTYTNPKGIVVSNVVGYSTDSVAQHTFAMLFYLLEKLSYYDNYVKSGTYAEDTLFTHFGKVFNELSGKTWGIIGMGNIGRRVASIAEAFGCKIIYYSTSGRNTEQPYKQVHLDDLLANADIISIHAPLNATTDNLLDYEALYLMKPSALLLNLGRGRIVNEADLTQALKENLLAGAALDVLEYEPMNKDNPLLEIKDSTKLLITPHIAWASVEARNRVVQEVKENIISFREGIPRNQVTE